MNNKIQNIVLGVLAVGLIGLTVAYASLSQNLTINGTAKVAAATWDIKFLNLTQKSKSGYAAFPTSNALTASGTTISGNIGTLKAPGDSLTYTFDIKNNGSINAKVNSVVLGGLSCTSATSSVASAVCNNLTYSIKYTDGKAITKDDELTSGATKNVTLTLTKANNTNLASEEVTVTANPTTINYIQK